MHKNPFQTGNYREENLNDSIVETFSEEASGTSFDVETIISRITTSRYTRDEIEQAVQ